MCEQNIPTDMHCFKAQFTFSLEVCGVFKMFWNASVFCKLQPRWQTGGIYTCAHSTFTCHCHLWFYKCCKSLKSRCIFWCSEDCYLQARYPK